MSKKILAILIVVGLLAVGTACFYEKKIRAPSKTPNQVETSTGNSSSSGASSSDDPGLVIKTENRASEEEADEMLKEVDRQLDSLIKALDELDAVDMKKLPDEEGK